MRCLISILLIFISITSFPQGKNETEKLLLKKVKYIKNHYQDNTSLSYQSAYQYVIDNIINSEKNYNNCFNYCKTVNYLNKKLRNKLPSELSKKLMKASSDGFYTLDQFLFSQIDKDSIHMLSEQWKEAKYLINRNEWINKHEFDLFHKKKNVVFEYFFKKLKDSKNFNDQNEIVNKCLFLFPSINENKSDSIDVLTLIIGGFYGSSWPDGKIQLFNYSYLNEYLKSQPLIGGDNPFGYISPPMVLLRYWLQENDANNCLIDSVSYETLNFHKGEFIDTLRSFKNLDDFIEVITPKFYEKKSITSEKLIFIQINYYLNQSIVRSRFFEYEPNEKSNFHYYEYHFKDGINIELAELTEKTKSGLDLLNFCKFSEAKNVFESLRKNNFPTNIKENENLDSLILRSEQLEYSLTQILIFLDESNKSFKEINLNTSLTHLNGAKLFFENIKYDFPCIEKHKITETMQAVEMRIDATNQQINFIESKISIGKDLIKKKEFSKALLLFQSERNNELSSDEKVNIELINLINETKELIEKESELKEISLIEKSILASKNLYELEKYEDALRTLESARKNNFKDNLYQNIILDENIKITQKMIENEKDKKLKMIFENSLNFTKIGKVEISKQYLKVDKFTNGDKLEFAATSKEFVDKTILGIPVYCYYNFESKFADKGYYYNVFAVNDMKGRKLLSEDYRLPFKAEITYINSIVKSNESKKDTKKRLLLQDYIFSSNDDLSYNGYMDVHYKRKQFNSSISNEIIERDYSKYGWLDENDELQHVFWILNDFDFGDYVGLRDDYTLFEVNYNLNHYSEDEGIPLALCQIPKEISMWDYQQQKVILNDNNTTIKDNLNNWSKEDFNLFASQIKVVKKRTAITNEDWLPYSTSKKLKFNVVREEYGSPKKEYSTIQYAIDEKKWMNLCNNGIPACASFEFNPLNDSIHGLVYNRFVFIGNNFPVVDGSKTMELIDLLDLNFSNDGNLNEFYNELFNEQNLKNGGKCYFSSENSAKNIKWQKGENKESWNFHESFSQGFGYIPITYYNRDNEKDMLILELYSSYNGSINQSFFKPEFEEITKVIDAEDSKRFDGFSIRFLKKDSPVKNKNLKSEDKPNFVISASSANSNRSSSYKKDEEIKNKKSSDYRKLNLPFVDSAPFPEEPFDIGSDRYVSKGNGTFGENKNTESTEKKIGSPIRLNDPVFPKYKIESNCRVCLQLTVNGNGEVINAKSTNSKTTCSGSSIIEEVIIQVIKQVKYSKDANSSISTKYITYLTVTLESE